jgi:hypothetical protein
MSKDVDFNRSGTGKGAITTSSFGFIAPPQFAGGLPEEGLVRKVLSEDEITRDYRNLSPEVRKATSQLLRNAGWRVPVTSKYNVVVRDALLEAYNEFSLEVEDISKTDPEFFRQGEYNLSKYLKDRTLRGEGTGGPRTTIYRQDPTDEALARGINEVYQELLGRGASQEEREKYTKKLRKELSKVENMAQTVTSTAGGTTTVTQRPGMDASAFLYQQLGGNDEVKTRQIFNFYDAFKRAIGVE